MSTHSKFIFNAALTGALLFGAVSVGAQQAQTPQAAQAAGQGQVFGAQYSPARAVLPGQAQVVYYRAMPAGARTPGGAHVYVDGHFQTSLLPNGYTAFCVAPGKHTLGAYLNDQPDYKGKTVNLFQAELASGVTYFLKVTEDGSSGAPVPVARETAERELANARDQIHALSRAPAVQACNLAAAAPAPAAPSYKDYTLSSDVLFAFGKSGYRDISAAGRTELAKLAQTLQSQPEGIKHITVIGHADLIGKADAAQRLGAARAATVKQSLAENGIPSQLIQTESRGNTEPVDDSCRKTATPANIACNEPNRRVVVRVEGQRKN
ncbi:OmpA family protein [Collimonas sp.]|jgi:OOP family OmpA-OmpF porin|uniref:OmpA family protein n=1 Tax=Collimonas sp. TaxID=1963772 RepID=UPI002B7F5FC1|nr:OmpA family protein [Collimonas sp.]HWX01533.1 OmpA family protein [Collimonas sp.]